MQITFGHSRSGAKQRLLVDYQAQDTSPATRVASLLAARAPMSD